MEEVNNYYNNNMLELKVQVALPFGLPEQTMGWFPVKFGIGSGR